MGKNKKHESTKEELARFAEGPKGVSKPKEKNIIPKLIPIMFVTVIVAIMLALNYGGYIDLENLFGPPLDLTTHLIKNSPYEIDFAPELIPMLNPDWKGERNGYTFYLESGKGFPPMGMILGTDGIVRGTPTIVGRSTFVVCVKDVGGNSKCVNAIFIVEENEETYVPPISRCPSTSHETSTPCGTNQTGGAGVGGVYVPLDCPCPSDTYDYGYNVVIEDVQYKTCVCK